MRRIFVSATTRELESYRLKAGDALRKRGYAVDDQAVFSLTYLEIKEKLEQRIADCDAVVCLIGFAYGGEPSERRSDQPRRSFTQWEYFLARKLNKPVYVLLADEKTPLDPDPREPEGDELRQLQMGFRDAVTRDRDWSSFASADGLWAELAVLRFPWEGPPPDHKPCNLPLVTLGTLFKGREAFLDQVRKGLAAQSGRATAIVTRQAVHGLGGVGKTRVAVEYAWRFGGDYTALLFVSAPTPHELRANLANLVGVLGMKVGTLPVDEQLAEVLRWLDAHPGWLLIVDNVDTDGAAREVEGLLANLAAGHVLITSRIGNWSAGVEPLELHVLAPAAALEFLLERTPHRRRALEEAVRAAAIARELDGLALALEQAGAYIDKLRLSFAEYADRWEAKRDDVLRWHDPRLMRYPSSVAVTWETTFAQLTQLEQRLLAVMAWLAPEPIPLFLLDATPLVEAIPEPREVLAGLAGYSLARFDATRDAALVHRLVQEITRGRSRETERDSGLHTALNAVNDVAPIESDDVRTWSIWTPLAPHAAAVSRHADSAGVATPTSSIMNQLGCYLQTRSQFREVERLFRRALALDEASFGPKHPLVATDLNNLAGLLRATNRLAEAEPLYRRALAIDEASFGPGHSSVAIRLNDLAGLLRAANRLAEAEPLYRRALAISQASFGPQHPTVAIGLNNLGMLLQDTNRLVEAEPLHRRALVIDEESYGRDHPAVAVGLNNLAMLLEDTNRPADAEPLYRRALAINEASYGPDHPSIAICLNNLAVLLRDTGREAEAEPLFRRALAIDEQSFGPDHPGVARDLNNLGELLWATDRVVEAEPLYRRALAIDEQSYGPNHPSVADDLQDLAALLRDRNRSEEAELLSRQAIEILLAFNRANGHEHPRLREAISKYTSILATIGQTRKQISTRLREIGRPFGVSLGGEA